MNALAVRDELVPVTFQEETVYLVEHEGEPYVPLRPLVENLGLDWKSQHAKVSADPKRWGCVVIITTQVGDRQRRQTLVIPLKKLFGFLVSIEPSKVKPAIRTKLEAYQAECDEVLWRHWTGQQANLPAVAAMTRPDLEELIEAKVWKSMELYHRHLDRTWRLTRRAKPPVTAADVTSWRLLKARGYTTSQIARSADRSPSTIRKHLRF